jgi:phosphinothricin acetyltransferase
MIIRAAVDGDIPSIAAIYGHHVLHGLGSFEEEPLPFEEIARRVGAVRELGLPYLVAEQADGAIGPEAMGKGVGKALLAEIIAVCEAMGLRQMMAVIGDSANAASIGLHRSLGFEPAGVCRAVGYKKDRWVDTVWMQRPLNAGDGANPDCPGLPLRGG